MEGIHSTSQRGKQVAARFVIANTAALVEDADEQIFSGVRCA